MKHLSTAAVVLSSGVVVSAAFSLVFWTAPHSDDFCRAGLQIGWSQFAIEMYQTWTGRWLAMALYAAVLPSVDITSRQYSTLLVVVWVGFLASLVVLVRLVLGKGHHLAVSGICAVILAALLLSGMPFPGETMYWLTGAVEYTLPFSLSILGVAAVVRASEHPRGGPSPVGWKVLGLTLILAVTGLHEIAGLTLCLILFAIAATARAVAAESAASWRAAVVVAAAGTLLSALAPGNAVRLELTGGTGSAESVLGVLRSQIELYLIPWVTDIRLVLASALLLGSPRAGTPEWAGPGNRILLVVVPAMSFGAVLAIFVVIAAKLGEVSPIVCTTIFTGCSWLVGWRASSSGRADFVQPWLRMEI